MVTLFINKSWDCRIHRLLFCRGVRPPPTRVLDMTLINLTVEVPVMLELWEMRSSPSLPSLLGLLWPRVVALNNVLSMDQIELNCVLSSTVLFEIELFWHLNCVLMLNWIVWNRTVYMYISIRSNINHLFANS